MVIGDDGDDDDVRLLHAWDVYECVCVCGLGGAKRLSDRFLGDECGDWRQHPPLFQDACTRHHRHQQPSAGL